MIRVVTLLSRAVQRAPVVVLVTAILLTALLGSFASRVVQGGGNEGFSPDNPELLAQQRAAEVFGSSGDVVLQVLLRAEEGVDLVGPAGVRATAALQQGLLDSPQADLLVQRPEQPAVVSPMAVVLQGAADQGVDPLALDEAGVDELFTDALAALPPEQTGFITGLLPDGTDLEAASSDIALAVVFLDPEALPEDDVEAAARVSDVADVIGAVEVEGVELEPFAFQLLFASTDSLTSEIARLFSLALGIIILILAFVFFAAPREDGSWGAAIRRTAADVGLTLAVVLMAIAWVQGAAGLLGPDGLGVIAALAEPAQILPVLLIGLGVDYGIHLTARYREETGHGTVPRAIGTATKTVGIALVLATVTTAVGFLTNITAPVPALRDFGILAAIGITAAFLLMLTVFPAARLLLDRRAEAAGRLPRQTLSQSGEGVLPAIMGRLAVLAERAAIPTLIVTVGIGGVLGGIGLANVSTEFSFTDFLPQDDPLIVTFETITAEFGGGFGETTSVVIDGPVSPDAHNAMVAATADLADVDDVVTFGDNAAASSPVAVLGQVLASLAPAEGTPGEGAPAEGAPAEGAPAEGAPAEGAPAEGAPAEGAPAGAAPVQPIDPALAGQIAGLVDPQTLTVPDGTDVSALYDLLLQASPAGAGQVIAAEEDVTRFIIQTDAGESGAGELGDALTETFAPVSDAMGDDGSVVATSDGIVSTRITDSLRDSQLQSLFIAVLAAMVLLVISFWFSDRRPFLGVITIAPVALIVLWTFGMMAATGIPVGPVTATIAALAVGIGVPYTIHVTNRWSEDRREQPTPELAIRATVRHTGGALAGSAFTTMAGFGVLVTSSLKPFQQFGLVTAYSIGFAMVAATVVLPSMLLLYDRSLRRRGDDPRAGTTPVLLDDGDRAVAEDGPWAPPATPSETPAT